MENLGVSPLPDGSVRLFSEYETKDLAYVGGTETKYVPIGDRVEVNVSQEPDITIARRLKDQRITNVVARQYKRRLDNTYVLYYDLIDYDETFVYETEIVSGKPVPVQLDVERKFVANVYLWSPQDKAEGWDGDEPGAYVDLHELDGRVERVDQNHVKYFLDLNPSEKRLVTYSVTDDCIGCTLCAQRCPVWAIGMQPYEKHEIDSEKCVRCGTCKNVCPVDAIIVE